jgi:hypothetical protein
MLFLYYVITPIVLLFATCKIIPRCRDFKKQVWKTNRFLIYSILILNMFKATFEMSDTIYKKFDAYDITYCPISMMLKTFFFDTSCLLTVQHMNIVLKHVEDPLVNKTNKVAKPLAISMIISGIHALIIVESFGAGYNHTADNC